MIEKNLINDTWKVNADNVLERDHIRCDGFINNCTVEGQPEYGKCWKYATSGCGCGGPYGCAPEPKKVEKPVDLAELMKLADLDRGAKIFKKCASCHNILKGEGAKVGPNLNGVVGRMKGSMAGFTYSGAMKEKGGIWDRESINQFITKPKEYISGTKMAFPGLKKPQDRADVILYLEKQSK